MSLEKIPCERCVETPEEVHHDRAELRRTLARECRARQAAEARERVAAEVSKCKDAQISELRQQLFEANQATAPRALTERIANLERETELLRDREKDFTCDRVDFKHHIESLEVARDRLKLRIVELEAGK